MSSQQIIQITKEFLPDDKVKELFLKLSEVKSEKTFTDVITEIKNLLNPPKPKPSKWLWLAFYSLVIFHFILVLSVGISFFALPFTAPPSVALPCMVFIWFFSTTRVECKLTNLENHLREKLGMRFIGGFVGHYFKRPIKRILRKFNVI